MPLTHHAPRTTTYQARLSHASALTRAAVVNSLRFTLTEFASGAPIPAVLLAALRQFLVTLEDADLKVRPSL